MEQQIVQIPSGKAIIIICGPTTCGKSSIARRLLKVRNGKYISYERIGNSISPKMGEEKYVLATTKMFAQEIEKAVMSEQYVVIETPFVEEGQLSGLIVSLRIYGYNGDITLIEVNLPKNIHLDYWQRKHNPKPNKKVLLQERAIFEKEILATDHSKGGGVNEIRITNPNAVKYKKA